MTDDRIDWKLDAVALIGCYARDDVEGVLAILHASDDIDHWRGVATTLAVLLASAVRELDPDDLAEDLDDLRAQARRPWPPPPPT